MAYETSVKFGYSMHWSTYWAHLRRDGVYRLDLNAELCHPLTSSIAKSWGEVFEQDLFAECGRRTTQAIEQVIEEIRLLRITRAMLCFGALLVAVHEALQKEQKEISRSLSPHVQQRPRDIYIRANLERGRGSVGRQKDIVNRGVDHNRGVMFAGVSKILMSKLVDAAEKLKTFSASVQSYFNDMNNVSEIDRAQLRRRWASDYENSRTTRAAGQTTYSSHDVGFNLDRLLGEHKAIKMETQTPSREPTPANPDGVAAVLTEKFRSLVDETVYSLHGVFRAGLEDKLRVGSAKASEMAYETSVEFSKLPWPTYRAHLRRDGVFRRDLNYELCSPLTSSIAKTSDFFGELRGMNLPSDDIFSWGEVFEQDLFAVFGQQATEAIERVIEEIENSSTPGLRERCRVQGDLAKEDAQGSSASSSAALREMIQIVHEALQKEQKDISRSLSPHVQKRLRDVYICAMLERGRGSTARQRDIVNRGVQDRRGDRFVGVSKILLSELDAAAETVGNALDASLSELARKVELLMSVLWENINSTAEQLVIRNAAVEVMAEISQQIQFWIRAEEACRKQGVLV